MRPEEFSGRYPGEVLRIAPHPCGFAFNPDDLPPDLELSWDTLRLAEEAALALGGLNDAIRGLPNPRLIVDTFVRSEAVASSRMEGTVSSLQQLALFSAGARDLENPQATKEVNNYFQALNLGIKMLESLPPSLRILRETHQRLLTDVRGPGHRVGDFRRDQNFIVNSAADLPSQARFVPPPVAQMHQRLDRFERYINRPERKYPDLIELALIHYQFEVIHPFEDGNGRIGRLLVSLLLHHWGLLAEPVLRLSPYFESRKAEYVDGLLTVSTHGTWERWIRLFLNAVRDQSVDSATRARALFKLREEYRARVTGKSRSKFALDIVDGLFELIAISAPMARDRYGMTFRTAQLIIDQLVADGIIIELTGQRRNRLYFAPGILSLVQAPLDSIVGP